MAEQQPSFSFGITTCTQMLAKLDRELERLSQATFDSRAVVDHSINTALTAWHLVDWVWQLHFRKSLKRQQGLAEKANVPPPTVAWDGKTPPKEFKRALFHLCDALETCEDIAIGAKHVFPEQHRPRSVEARVSTRAPEPFILDASRLGRGDILANENGAVPDETQYLPKVGMSDGSKIGAIETFDHAMVFWSRFLAEFEIP